MNLKRFVLLGVVTFLFVAMNAGAASASTRFAGMTYAYLVDEASDVASIPADVDATFCDIGILIVTDDIVIEDITVHDAKQFGIAVDESSGVEVRDCIVYNIGYHTAGGVWQPPS